MIPDEAVEAAAKAILGVDDETWALQVPELQERYREDARNALMAAAPYVFGGLRADLVKLAQEFDTTEGGTLAYTVIFDRFGTRMRKNAHDQLMHIVENHLHAEETR